MSHDTITSVISDHLFSLAFHNHKVYYLNVSVNYLVVMQVFETLQNLFGVEADGRLVVFQRTPL